uniref:Uncharacterized protein n=1 Tax=Ralstonia solanacearum TaxID=305 RepID=A0A0S4TXR5_RALSL|nr:protein of unknown function [Ralstonia solanacearum]
MSKRHKQIDIQQGTGESNVVKRDTILRRNPIDPCGDRF